MRIGKLRMWLSFSVVLAGAAIAQTGVEEFQIEEKTGAPKVSEEWLHVSETSATVYWQTDLPADSFVEYGATEQYGSKTEARGKSVVSGKPFFTHLHALKGLEAGKTYHYRTVSTSTDGKAARGENKTFATKKIEGAIRVPGDLKGPPYVLDKEGATYVLASDIVAPATAIDILAGVTLDLDGHTVVYNDEKKTDFDMTSFNAHIKNGAFGIRIRGPKTKVAVFNGTIRQGKAAQEAHDGTIGFNPIYCSGTPGFELAGVTCEYSGRQVSGIILHWGGQQAHIHHNAIHDLGKLISDRHRCVSALKGLEAGCKVHHNLVQRSRQCGIMSGSEPTGTEIDHNEVYIDSYSINSFALGLKNKSQAHDNRIFGCGSNCVAFGTTGGCDGVEVFKNYVRLYGRDISDRKEDLNKKEMESSETSVMSGPRVTWGCKSVDYHDNTIIVTGSDGSMIRGTFLFTEVISPGVKFHDNVVAAIALDDKTNSSGAIAMVGKGKPDAAQMLFANNLVISNFANVNGGDSYGTGNNCRLVGNTFRKVGDRKGYFTIRLLPANSNGHVFIDSKFEGGAGYEAVSVTEGAGFSVGWTLAVKTAPGAAVAIKDKDGKEVFSGQASAEGLASVELIEYTRSGASKRLLTPHTVTVKKDGAEKSETVTVDAKKEIAIKF
jgi:hypothetical protein